jgi:lysophospholipase L1-like esterase
MKKIVFLGDSITANFQQLKFHNNVLNYGVSGDRTIDVIERLRAVKDEDPDQLVLMIGINDVLTNHKIWFTDLPISIKTTYEFIVKYLVSNLNTNQIILCSILPISSIITIPRSEENLINEDIDQMNQFIKQLAIKHHLTYIDLNQHFKDENKMKRSLTSDGVHLTDEGYELFYQKILIFLNDSE